MKRFAPLIATLFAAYGNGARMDTATELFIDQQLEAMEAQAYKLQFVDLKARLFIPPKSDVNPGADTFAYRVLTPYGRADFISDYADELQSVGLRGEKKVGRVETIGNKYEYSAQDLRAASFTGTPLDSEMMEAAMRAHEERVDATALVGDAKLGFIGLFNHPDIVILSTTGVFSGLTGAQMLADLHRLADKVMSQSKGKFMADTILLPLTTYQAIAAKPVDTAGSVQDTVLEVFLRNRKDIRSIDWSISLETLSATGAKRALCYKKDPKVLQLCIPMEPVMHAPEIHGFIWSRAIESRFGGCLIRQPLAMCYMDGF